MAKPSSIRWTRAITAYFSPSGDALLLLLAIATILSLLTHELSRRSALAADFEGFDSDDLDDTDIDEPLSQSLNPSTPPPTTLTHSSTPESHHGPPHPSPPTPSDPSSSSPPDPAPAPKPPSPLDFWDEDEFEGLPDVQSPVPDPVSQPSPLPPAADPAHPKPVPTLRSYTIEIICISFVIAFALNFFTGRRQNEVLALSWAATFAVKDSIFDKNFSLLGTGDGKEDAPLLLKEGQDVFRFYASGRRHCQCLLATMELRSRHDLISRILDLVFTKKDTIMFEVVMNEEAMDHVALAIARRKLAKAMLKEARDLQRFATLVTSPPVGRQWVADELAVVAESKEVAGDLINDVVLDQVFGDKAFEKFGKWFISLHFSDHYLGSDKKILTFKFVLPDANNMADMTRLITLVPYYIDLIGRYKLSSQARSKTEVARRKAAQEAFKELQDARQDAMQKRKAEKKKLQEGAEAKLSAEAVRKKEEKERARQLKKAMPRVKKLRS